MPPRWDLGNQESDRALGGGCQDRRGMHFREFPRLSGRLLLRRGHLLRELVPRTFWTCVQWVLPELLVGPDMGGRGHRRCAVNGLPYSLRALLATHRAGPPQSGELRGPVSSPRVNTVPVCPAPDGTGTAWTQRVMTGPEDRTGLERCWSQKGPGTGGDPRAQPHGVLGNLLSLHVSRTGTCPLPQLNHSAETRGR